MYLFKHAYPAAKRLLQSRISYRAAMKKLIDLCRADCASPLWDELAECDYESELNRLIDWWPARRRRKAPPDGVEVLFVALEDVPYSFTLRGSTKWSRDPKEWDWWYDDDYMGPRFESKIMSYALERSEIIDRAKPPTQRRSQHAPMNSDEVVEMFFSLGHFGLMVRELIRNVDDSRILGNRSSRWFVIGHPDAVYGIILGERTRTRWRSFHG